MNYTIEQLLDNKDLMYTSLTDLEETYFDTIREIVLGMDKFDPSYIAKCANNILSNDGNSLDYLEEAQYVSSETFDLFFKCCICELISRFYNNKDAYANDEFSAGDIDYLDRGGARNDSFESNPLYASQYLSVFRKLDEGNNAE